MKIAVDAMGGDKAPLVIIDGVSQALFSYDDIEKIILVGKTESIIPLLKIYKIENNSKIEIIHSSEVIEMHESSITSLRKKKKSSISICIDLAKEKKVDAIISAGHTGACVASSVVKLRPLKGIFRPAIATIIPNAKNFFLLIDAGANIDSKPEHLVQFAEMGSIYSSNIMNVANPRVGLLSIGEEETKGNELTKETFETFKKSSVNFIGNIEGNDLFSGKVDVVVCDGFVGNVVLKSSESVSKYLLKLIKDSITKTFFRKIGAFILKGAFSDLKQIVEYDEYGGAPLLGVDGIVIIGHGSSSPKAIKNAVRVAINSVKQGINQQIIKKINLRKL